LAVSGDSDRLFERNRSCARIHAQLGEHPFGFLKKRPVRVDNDHGDDSPR
jgi:hypothetical protein